jgi:ubiquitin-conjugating enzyme E2 variant
MSRHPSAAIVAALLLVPSTTSFSLRVVTPMGKMGTRRWSSSSGSSSSSPLLESEPQLQPQPAATSNPTVGEYDMDAAARARIPKGSAPEFAIPGDSTEETPMQRALLMTHFSLASLNLAMAASAFHASSLSDVATAVAVFALSVVVGDFGTGVFHWSVDNYGSIKTPVVGTVCAAFQGHHVTPWTITFRGFANNVYKICYGTVPALLLLTASPLGPLSRMFCAFFVTWWMVSQELHKWSHMRTTPKAIKFFQDLGVILSKKEHGMHHTAPFEAHYCILTGVCNPLLDRSQFFRYLEAIVYRLTGNKPNTWKEEPALEDLSLKMLPI